MGVIARNQDDDPLLYVSFRFGRQGEAPPPVIPEHLVEDFPKVAAGIVAFDAWIGNEDRHRYNLAYARDPLHPIAVFDHSHALFGHGTEGASGLKAKQNLPMVSGCLARLLPYRSHLNDGAAAIGRIRESTIKSVCEAACQHGAIDASSRDALVEFLIWRKTYIHDLLDKAGGAFPQMTRDELS